MAHMLCTCLHKNQFIQNNNKITVIKITNMYTQDNESCKDWFELERTLSSSIWTEIPFTTQGCTNPHPVWPEQHTGMSTTCLGNLFQCLIALIMKNFFLLSHLNLLPFSSKLLPLVLLLHSDRLSSAFLWDPFRDWKVA